jgi:hypothetical protein
MRTHVEFAHPKLVVRRKLAIVKKIVVVISHITEWGEAV